MSENIRLQPFAPLEDINYIVGTIPDEIKELTRFLLPSERIRYWSSFKYSIEVPYPKAATGKTVDDIAAVMSGSKPATLFSPEQANDPKLHRLIAEEGDRYGALSIAQATDYYGGQHYFLGLQENVNNLAELYNGRGGKDSPHPMDADFHKAVGEILGYPPEVIDHFINGINF